MEVTNKTTSEDIQRFIRKNRLQVAYECAGFLFRVKEHAERHSKLNKDAAITEHAKEEKAPEEKKSKKSETKAPDNGLN